MGIEERKCKICGCAIPEARLKAMPDTLVCVKCSEKIGGENELEVRVGSTGKAGSIKKTGQVLEVKLKPKNASSRISTLS